jgi:hypothetical protein
MLHSSPAHAYCDPPQTWNCDAYTMQYTQDIPHISTLLLREADAWRSVLSLHASTVSGAQQLLNREDNKKEQVLNEERVMSSESREASYCTALTALASQCDTLHSECLKLRMLRKSRCAVEVRALAEVIRPSSDEILARGKVVAANASLSVATITSDVRIAIQAQRSQISQLRALLEAVDSASALPLIPGTKLVIGVERGEGNTPFFCGLDDFLKEVYDNSRALNETSLTEAMSRVFLDRNAQEDVPTHRQFPRRKV